MKVNNDSIDAFSYYRKGKMFLKSTEHDSSIFYLYKALPLIRSLDDQRSQVDILFDLIRNYDEQGEFKKIEELLEEVDDLVKEYFPKDNLLKSQILHYRGSLMQDLGNISESINLIKESIRLRIMQNGKNDLELSLSYHILGYNYFLLGDFENALEYYYEALDIRKTNGIVNDLEIARYYRHIGIIAYCRGKFSEAMENYQLALSISKQVGNDNNRELAAVNIAVALSYMRIGEYYKALDYLGEAERIYTNIYGPEYYYLSWTYKYKGLIYIQIQDYVNALEVFQKSISLQKEILKSEVSSTYYYCAISNERLGNIDLAEHYYRLYLSESLDGAGKDTHNMIRTYINYGAFCMRKGEMGESIDLFMKALKISRDSISEFNIYEPVCLTKIGDYYLELGNLNKALNYYNEVLKCFGYDPHGKEFTETTNEESFYYYSEDNDNFILHSYAEALRRSSLRNENDSSRIAGLLISLKCFEDAVQIITNNWMSYNSLQSKMSFVEGTRGIYSNTILCMMDLMKETGNTDYKRQAFEYVEKSRSAVLLSSIRNLEAFTLIPTELQLKEKEIRQNILFQRNSIYKEKQEQSPNSLIIDQCESNIFKLNKEYENLLEVFERDYPEYFALKYNTDIVSTEEVQSKLKENEGLIEYHLSDSILYTFVLTREEFEMYEQYIDSNFFTDINTVRDFVGSGSLENVFTGDYRAYKKSAYSLYKKLIEPCNKIIRRKKLILVPDEILSLIPFEALLTTESDLSSANYNKMPYLIREYCISYSYSATLLYNKTPSFEDKRLKVLAFASDYNQQQVTDKSNMNQKLVPLQKTVKEIEEILDYYAGELYYNTEATEANFKGLAKNADIIHLALHAGLDKMNPMYSKLIFNPDTSSGEDGLLNVFEIYDMELGAKMIVLSACGTGDGKVNKGEGVLSIARSFIHSGCQSIITTLWSIPDDSAGELMKLFYGFLSTGMDKDEALRQAKLKFLDETKDPVKHHPHFWAGYVVQGDSAAIGKGNSIFLSGWSIAAIAFLLGIFSTLMILRRMKSKAVRTVH